MMYILLKDSSMKRELTEERFAPKEESFFTVIIIDKL